MNKLYSRTQDVTGIPEIIEGETIEEYRERINKEYQDLQMKINSLEFKNERLEITRDYATDLEKEKDKLQKDYDELRDRNNRLEHNFKYRRLGNYLVEDLIYAAENYEDKNVIDDYLIGIAPLNEWGKQYNDRFDRVGERSSINQLTCEQLRYNP